MSSPFKRTSNIRDYKLVLDEVQEYMSTRYASAFEGDSVRKAAQIKLYIKQYLEEKNLGVQDLTTMQLVDKIYSEMKEASFLTEYLDSKETEEINMNAWDDIKVTKWDGDIHTLDEHFNSPQHALDVIKRLLRPSGAILDDESPMVRGHLRNNIRITAYAPPVIDAKAGVAASIRIINPQHLSKDDFVRKGTAEPLMLEQLILFLRYGISICISGSVGCGKTTTLSLLLEAVRRHKRIFTIEVENREFDLVEKDEHGKTITNVVHTVTRRSDDPKRVIDVEKLLEYALTSNPDIVCIGEMKSSEAYGAQEAANTGTAVLTTTHANSCEATYPRIRTLCKKKYDLKDETLDGMIAEGFPIVAFQKQLEDKSRKIMEITECEVLRNGEKKLHTLWRFNVEENLIEDGKTVIKGDFEKAETISEKMQKRLIQNGMTQSMLNQFFLGGGTPYDTVLNSISSVGGGELFAPKIVAGGNGR
ncbi:CpaF/VirB11 family protein [Desulfitobacterium chlororespirans]|uniref:Pilus assembly protein CpaF n=1 Tax=Desulfitobacterium chlororespirans DSM 11544 TaxID=1121395 RepID=A0A1M7UY69_9FIRM|nr:CpaF/VirB11 family protein [Desulfitobacterium chlororespirans]SHN87909.1 pilus assembly protein CpaF [Desulfitobacterium chlororespirans DSM 11544]